MSKRADIIDGTAVNRTTKFGLVYTCKCGWIDVGHAFPFSSKPNQGANHLWKAISSETGDRSANKLWFKVTFQELMILELGVTRDFAVRVGLSRVEQESVALGIFMSVSVEFEKQQGFPYSFRSDSSFSAEDLVSNLVGFYRAVRHGQDYIKLCEPVSKEAAERIWDTYGPVGSTAYKVRDFRPWRFPCSECAENPLGRKQVPLPNFLDSIRPAKLGTNYRVWDENHPDLNTVPGAPSVPTGKTIPLKPGDTLSGIAKSEYGTFDLWPLVWDQNPSVVVGGNPNRLKPTGTVVLAPLSSFSSAKLADAKKRAPTWKNYPR